MNKTKVMMITGAARRIGAGLATYFHEKGYNLILHYRNSKEDAEQLANALNAKRASSVKLIQADFKEDFDYKNWLNKAIGSWDRLDVLINNASVFYPAKFAEITVEQWYDLFASNAKAPLFLSQAAMPFLKKQKGNIINVIDASFRRPKRDYIVYSMAKSALYTLTLALAKECASLVRVNAVSPGSILWPEGKNELTKTEKEKLLRAIPLGQQGRVADIAFTIDYFISANYTTGIEIAVDGGRLLGND